MLNIQKHVAEIPPERPDISQYPSDAWDYCSGRKNVVDSKQIGAGENNGGGGAAGRPPGPPQGAPIRSPDPGPVRRCDQLEVPQLLDPQGLSLGLSREQGFPSYPYSVATPSSNSS